MTQKPNKKMDKTLRNEPITDAFRYKVVSDYLSQGGSFKEAARRNDISDGTLQRWIRIFAPSSEFETELTEKGNDMDTEEKKKLEKRIKELEKALEYSNLRADAYSKMIDVAEEVLNISIRKKSGTKQ
ncbi:MAG: transposase [Bacteroidales bacterium]